MLIKHTPQVDVRKEVEGRSVVGSEHPVVEQRMPDTATVRVTDPHIAFHAFCSVHTFDKQQRTKLYKAKSMQDNQL